MNYCSGSIDIILNKNYVSMLSFLRVFNPTGFYRDSAWIVMGSAGALPGSTGALPESTGALPASSGNDRGSTGINRSFTWALPGWSGTHPGWLVGNFRSAAGVTVTATIIHPRSSRIIPVTYRGGPGLCRESVRPQLNGKLYSVKSVYGVTVNVYNLHPGRFTVDDREQPGYIRNSAGNNRDDPAFGPGWNSIFNTTGVVRDDPER
jgi:hypothetical protein